MDAIKCLNKGCQGTLQCVRDASVTRAVTGAIIERYKYGEGFIDTTMCTLSDESDVNTYDDYTISCNECDEEFSEQEVYDHIHNNIEVSE
jgi:hypothetical protein